MDLSIVIPCYNESNKIVANLNRVFDYMKKFNNLSYEIIVVDDGSADNTYGIIDSNVKNPLLKLCGYDANRGKGYAVNYGMKKAIGNTILFMDADLATDLSAIDTVLKECSNYDIIIGDRRNKESTYRQSKLRLFTSKCCNIISNLIIPLNLSDTQCGFKAFNAKCAKEILALQKMDNFVFDVELLYIAKLHNHTIKSIPVLWKNGCDSKVNVVSSSVKFFKDLVKIRKNKKYYTGGIPQWKTA